MSGLQIADVSAASLVPAVLLVTLATVLAWLVARSTPSAARRNSVLLPTLWLVLLAPFAPLFVQILDLSIDIPTPFTETATTTATTAVTTATATAQDGFDQDVTPYETPASMAEGSLSPARTTPSSGSQWTRTLPWMSILFGIWVLGTVVALSGIFLSWLHLRRLVRRARPAPEYLGPAIEQARRLIGLRRYPQVAICDRIATPVAVGWGRQARVLLPTASTESLNELDWVHALAHEAAHHAHGDPVLQILRRVTRAIWWWHPAVHRLDMEVERTREELADNAVLSAVDPLAYSETLLAWGRLASSAPRAALAVGLMPGHDSLESRIRNLLTPRRCTMARSRPLILTTAALVATSLCLAASATRLVDQPAPSPETTQGDVEAVTGEWIGTFSGDSPGLLDVDIKGGDIRVIGHDDDRVIVRWAVPQAKGELSATPIDLDIRPKGSTIEINSDDYSQTTHIEVQVPRRTDLILDSYRNGTLQVQNVRGAIRARSQNNDIVLENVAGSARVYGYNGNFSASFAEVDGELSFESYNGTVDLTLPDDVGLAAQLRTDRGKLRSTFELNDFKGGIGRSKQPQAVSLGEPFARATIGDGKHPLKIETTNGDISLLKRSDERSR